MLTKPLTKSKKMESRNCQERQIIRLLAVKVAKSLVVKVLAVLSMWKSLILFGAEGGTRTPTGIRPLDPEPSASTSSATSAWK